MSRSNHSRKPGGFDYWSKRAGGKFSGIGHGRHLKLMTNKCERADRRKLERELKENEGE